MIPSDIQQCLCNIVNATVSCGQCGTVILSIYCKTINVGVHFIFSVFTIHDLLASIKFSAIDNAAR